MNKLSNRVLSFQKNKKKVFSNINLGTYIIKKKILNKYKKQKFGIGGIGKIGSDLLPTPECVINEHTRLKSSGVILSRSFKGNFSEESKELFETELT